MERQCTGKEFMVWDIENSETVTVNNAHGNTAGPYVVETAIPFDFFANSDFKITFAGTTVDIKDIEY